jgi:hypothetical protein
MVDYIYCIALQCLTRISNGFVDRIFPFDRAVEDVRGNVLQTNLRLVANTFPDAKPR